MEERRISKFTNLINTIRNASEKGNSVRVKTENIIAYMQKSNSIDEMYNNIESDTNQMRREQRERADRQVRDARNDFADLGIGEMY